MLLDDHLDFSTTAELLAGAAGRALGVVLTKFKNFRNIGFINYLTRVSPPSWVLHLRFGDIKTMYFVKGFVELVGIISVYIPKLHY